jgi:hypothetical protein
MMISLGRDVTNPIEQHSNKIPKSWRLIKNQTYPEVLDGIMVSLIDRTMNYCGGVDQHQVETPRGVYKIKLVDGKALNSVVLDNDLGFETYAFRIHMMVVMTSAILLVYLVIFASIRCPHEPAILDVKHHTAGLAFYVDQSHSCKLKKEAAVFHLGSYLIKTFAVS